MCEQYLTNPLRLAVEFLKWYELFTTAIIGDILKNKCFEYSQKMNVCTFKNTELYIFEEWQKFNGETMSSRLWQFFFLINHVREVEN